MHLQICCFDFYTYLLFLQPSRRGIVKSLLLHEGERDSEDSEDEPIVLINKVTNKMQLPFTNFSFT